jgi:hypothetical protein
VAALASHPLMKSGGGDAEDRARFERHLKAARAAATHDALLAKNLEIFDARFRPATDPAGRGGR